MRIVGLEGVHHFQLDGGVGNSCNMVVELTNGEQFRVQINSSAYSTLSQLGEYAQSTKLAAHPTKPSPQNNVLQRPEEKVAEPTASLQDFANAFITGPNQNQKMALAQELVDTSDVEANNLVSDPVAELKKIGMFGEPQDILKTLSNAQPLSGPDVVESFEDTTDQYEEEDPGEEHVSIAEQF